jgi:hypothetical protein
MDPRFFRKYSNLVEAAEKDLSVNQINEAQLTEGIMDILQRAKGKLQQMFNPQDMEQIKSIVNQATGGNPQLSIANAKKVGAALMGGGQQMAPQESAMNEGPNDTPLVQKLKAAATTLGLVGGAAAMVFGGSILGVVGIIALFISSFTASDSYNMGHSGRDV